MPRIRCHYVDCVFLDEGYCAAAAVELDPEEGCLTFSPSGEISPEKAWESNEALEEEWADIGFEAEEEDELWLEESEEELVELDEDDLDELDDD